MHGTKVGHDDLGGLLQPKLCCDSVPYREPSLGFAEVSFTWCMTGWQKHLWKPSSLKGETRISRSLCMHGHTLNDLSISQKGSCQEGRKPWIEGAVSPLSQLDCIDGLADPSDVLPQTCLGHTRICLKAKSNDSNFVALLAFLRTQLIHTIR